MHSHPTSRDGILFLQLLTVETMVSKAGNFWIWSAGAWAVGRDTVEMEHEACKAEKGGGGSYRTCVLLCVEWEQWMNLKLDISYLIYGWGGGFAWSGCDTWSGLLVHCCQGWPFLIAWSISTMCVLLCYFIMLNRMCCPLSHTCVSVQIVSIHACPCLSVIRLALVFRIW